MNICCFFVQKVYDGACNVGYSRAVYPVLCKLSFIILWSLYICIHIQQPSCKRQGLLKK